MQLSTVFTKTDRMINFYFVIKIIKIIYFQIVVNLSFEKFKMFIQN